MTWPFAGGRLELTAVVVDDYDEAIAFFTEVLGFRLVDDRPATTNDGRPKRWVVVTPPAGGCALLLARADGPEQAASVGNQTGGRVTFFLRVDDFEAAYDHLVANDVTIVRAPFDAPFGRCTVFLDIAGNRWDLLGPAPAATSA